MALKQSHMINSRIRPFGWHRAVERRPSGNPSDGSALYWVALACAVSLFAGPASAQRRPALTRAQDIRELGVAQAALRFPVSLRGVVTYFDPAPAGDGDLFVQDSTAGIWVDFGKLSLSLTPGDLVQIEGVTTAPDFAPQVKAGSITVVGKGPIPLAPQESFERLASSAEDSQWVSVEGIVRSATVESGRLVLGVAADGGRLTARIPGYTAAVPAGLIDSRVRLQGACGALFNQRNQLMGVVLYVPSTAQISMVEAGARDPFGLPEQPIASVLRFRPNGTSGHRVRVQGVVTYQNPGRSLYIRDASQGMYVQTTQDTRVAPGDRVSVAGFPAVGAYTPVLEDAVFVRLAKGQEPVPHKVSAEQAASGAYDSDVISVDGWLQGQEQRGADHAFYLRSGGTVFQAQVQGQNPALPWPHLLDGSHLRLTGVCVVRVDQTHAPIGFELLLRVPEDIVVLERPPWFTLKRAGWVLSLLGLGLLVSIVWGGLLNRQVHKQTALLMKRLHREIVLERQYRDLFDNAGDMVFTHDFKGKILSMNHAGELITGRAQSEALEMKFEDIIAPASVAVWQEALTRTLPAQMTANYELEIISKDGRRLPLEVSSRVIMFNGLVVTVQSEARDITARRKEETLAAAEKRVLEMIADRVSAPVVLEAICRMVEHHLPGLAASIVTFDSAARSAQAASPPIGPGASARQDEAESTTGALKRRSFAIVSADGHDLGAFEARFSQTSEPSPDDFRVIMEHAVPLARVAIVTASRLEQPARVAD